MVTGISQTSETVAEAPFSANLSAGENATQVIPFEGSATFRLFDDGWRLDSVTKK